MIQNNSLYVSTAWCKVRAMPESPGLTFDLYFFVLNVYVYAPIQ